jgi:hypothetical protein
MMSTSFDPNIAKNVMKPAAAQRERTVYDERVFMQVQRFQLSRDGGDEWAIGHSITNPDEKFMVRLTTAEERMADLPQINEARLRQSYEGENRRETLAEKAQAKIVFIAFDGARPLGVTDDGVKQYRAHWPQTMAAKPEAEVTSGLGSIVLYQPKEGSGNKADAYVEFLRTATLADGSNVQQAVESALAITDADGNGRDPHALMRVFYNGDEVATARVFPAREKTVVTDPLYGDQKTIMQPIDAANSFQALRNGTATGIQSMDANNDLARAIISGLMQEEAPPAPNVISQDQMDNFYHGAKSGDLSVEIIGAERIKFGVDSAKTYLKSLKDSKGRDNRKLTDYLIKTEVEGKVITERGYGNTVVAFQRYPNGQPYAVYASPQENLPRVSPLAHFDLDANRPDDSSSLYDDMNDTVAF